MRPRGIYNTVGNFKKAFLPGVRRCPHASGRAAGKVTVLDFSLDRVPGIYYKQAPGTMVCPFNLIREIEKGPEMQIAYSCLSLPITEVVGRLFCFSGGEGCAVSGTVALSRLCRRGG
jgi:hypothetical protein